MSAIVTNFTFPLSTEHRRQLTEILQLGNEDKLDIRESRALFDPNSPFSPQAASLVDDMRLTADECRNATIIAVPPGHPSAAIALVMELRRRLGRTPACVRFAQTSSTPRRYRLAELMTFEEEGY